MSQSYVTVLRKNLAKPQETPRYYAVARSGRVVSIRDVAKRIAERSSFSRGELEGCVGEFLLEMLNVLEEGNIVQLADMGNFRMTIKTATPTLTADEFKANCIEGGHVVFHRARISGSCARIWNIPLPASPKRTRKAAAKEMTSRPAVATGVMVRPRIRQHNRP